MSRLFKTTGSVVIGIALVVVYGNHTGAAAEDLHVTTKKKLNDTLIDITETHPEILEARARYRSVLEERSIAKSGYLPTFGTELIAGQEITDGEDTNDERKNLTVGRAMLYARQNLYNGGKTKAFLNEMDSRILAAAYEVLNVANRVYLETTEAYLQVLESREKLGLSKIHVLTQERILEQVREKTESGFSRISDLKNSEARLALARSNYISRQQDLNQGLVKFHRQFGRFLKAEAFVKPSPVFVFPETIEDTVDIALKQHPAIEVAKYNTQVRKYSFEKTKADYWPTIDLELKAEHRTNTGGDKGDTDQLSAMLKLNHTFFDGGVRKGQKKKAFENIHKENQRAYVERRNVNETARLAWNIMQAEILKKKYMKTHVLLSTQTLNAFKEEYHIGRRTLLDLLNMENEFNAANIAKVESDFSFLTAYYRISQATGILLHEFHTGLRFELGLPPDRQFNLKTYKELNKNRDDDTIMDIHDQCDNTAKGDSTFLSGCGENGEMVLGYQEPTDLSPYIVPKKGTPVAFDMKIDTRKEEQSIAFDTITFKTNSARLTANTRKILVYIADQLKATQSFTIEVIGHTDSSGSSEYNMKLSVTRAEIVRSELVSLGVDEDLITWSGRGEDNPIASNSTSEGRSKNRRTEFKLVKKKTESK